MCFRSECRRYRRRDRSSPESRPVATEKPIRTEESGAEDGDKPRTQLRSTHASYGLSFHWTLPYFCSSSWTLDSLICEGLGAMSERNLHKEVSHWISFLRRGDSHY
uniref:SRCR domain-containing protein n=1 Tax=Steinernema glaseri TaxID=37863 RepID=A0A1I7Z2H2_9BILA